MAAPRADLVVLALTALGLVACLAVLLLIHAIHAIRRPRHEPGWQERRTLIRLERALTRGPDELRFIAEMLDEMGRSRRPPIERIASDLRRLGRQRMGVASRNSIWHEAVNQAYDDRLRLACGCLGVPHHLSELDGLDLEIERVRVEGELRAAGLFFTATGADTEADRR